MNIVEIFYSLQGEGRLTGVPSVFIRVAGCTVRCPWCDTKYAWDESSGEDLSIDEILHRVDGVFENRKSKIENPKFFVVTGGEPMTNQHLPLLLTKLAGWHGQKRSVAMQNCHITVETSGIAFIPDLPVDLMSISPKLSLNQQQKSNRDGMAISEAWPWLPHVRKLIKHYDYQLKFVIDSEDDVAEAKAVVDSIKEIDLRKVMLMPQAKTRDELLAKSPMVAELCTRYGYTFCQRLHVLLWDTQRGR